MFLAVSVSALCQTPLRWSQWQMEHAQAEAGAAVSQRRAADETKRVLRERIEAFSGAANAYLNALLDGRVDLKLRKAYERARRDMEQSEGWPK